MKFKTKVAYSAVLATLSLAAGTAQAAYLSEQGTGQVLFYPYYTVQDGTDTYISVVNTTSQGKAVKVRFIEAKASYEVLDFNLYLSPYDVWNAAVTASGTAATDPAMIVTNDKSCTVPKVEGTGGIKFRNGAYATKDQNGDGLDRTREGYVELIEMGTITTANILAGKATAPTLGWASLHSNGKPNDCAWIQSKWDGAAAVANSVSWNPTDLGVNPPSGGLIGTGTLINPKSGVDYSYDPVAIEDYNSTSFGLHYAPGSLSPSMTNAEPTSAVIHGTSANRSLITTDWTDSSTLAGTSAGVDAVSAVLMRSNVYNEYTSSAALSAGTDWVVTFPTKNFYVKVDNAVVNTSKRPFTPESGLKTVLGASGSFVAGPWLACEPVKLSRYDREEAAKSGKVDFSPSTGVNTCLKWEANVITFASKNVLGSVNVKTDLTSDMVFEDGWMDMQFTGAHALAGMVADSTVSTEAGVNTVTTTFVGLPTVGFAVQKYVNSTFNGGVGNYGGSFAHKYLRTIK
jgi:hypothetical protein